MTQNAPSTSPQAAANRRGLLLMLGGFFAFSCADTFAKLLTADFHPVQITWVRQSGLLVAVLILLMMRGPKLLQSAKPGLQILRGLTVAGTALGFVIALRFVPLAEAVAVSFLAPFLVTLLAMILLKEPVGPRRWAAIVVGFVGVLIVMRPGFGVLHPAIGIVVLATVLFALRQVISRFLQADDTTATTMAFTALTASGVLLIPMIIVWETPTELRHVIYFVLMACVAGTAEFLIIRALEIANAVVVAPMQYALILFASFWGYTIFGDLPDLFTWIGSAIIVASGLYTLYRESRVRRA